MRNSMGQFMKGHKCNHKTKKQISASMKNLSAWIGRIPPMLGKKHSLEVRENMSMRAKGKVFSKETREKLSLAKRGEKHPSWIKDRTLIKRQDRRDNPLYKEWRNNVWIRDNFKCKIADENCKGRIEAHHILNYTNYPELRYKVNNGITLCHTHHPFKRTDEVKLSPFFQSLVAERS